MEEQDELETTFSTIFMQAVNDEESEPDDGIINHEKRVDLIPANIELSSLGIRNEEQERVDDEERKRRRSRGRRQSLCVRLAEKKAIVAAGDENLQREKQRQEQRDAVAVHGDI